MPVQIFTTGASQSTTGTLCNADVNELDTNEDGLAAEDGLMSDPLDTLRQAIVNLDEKELEEAENENEKKKLEEAEKNKKRQRGQRGQRGNN